MKQILYFMLSCMLLLALTACNHSDARQLVDTMLPSGITKGNKEIPTDQRQNTATSSQNPAEEEPGPEPEAPAKYTVSKGEPAQPPAVKQPQSNISTGMKPAEKPSQESSPQSAPPAASEENTVFKMNVQVGNSTFTATLADNSAAASLVEMMKKAPVVIQMSDYSGFEKVGSLETSLPASNSQTTTQSGDIVLYNGNQLVIFYGSNSWSYTRIGKVDDLSGWKEALGSGTVEVTFKMQNEK